MPNTSTGIYYPPAGAPATLRTFFTNLATTADAAIVTVRNNLTPAIQNALTQALNAAAGARAHAEDAHRLTSATVQGSSGSAQAITTSGAGIGGLSYGIPAGYGASFTATFDVRCTSLVAGSVFLGTVNAIDRRNNTPTAINGQAPFEATAANQRTTTTTANTIPAVGYDRTLQPIVVKTSNGGYEVTPANCRLQVTLTRTGSA